MKVIASSLLFWRGACNASGAALKNRLSSIAFHEIVPTTTATWGQQRSFHEWLLPPNQHEDPTSHYPDFADCMKRASVDKIAFLRHGKTGPKPENGVDFDRTLTDEGRTQAQRSGSSFGHDLLLPLYRTVIVSPAPRTMETAKLFLEAAGIRPDDDVALKPVAEAYDGTMQPEGSKLFAKIGYAPLAKYVRSNDNDDDRETAQRVLGAYAHSMLGIFYNTVRQDTASESAPADARVVDIAEPSSSQKTLLFVGHAIYLPAAALGVASLIGCDTAAKEMILTTVTGEAEGYLIQLVDGPTVSYLTRPAAAATG